MPILTRKAVVLAKVEVTSGTDAVPVGGTDAILVADPVFTIQGDELTRNFVSSDLSPFPSRFVRKRAQLTFSVEIRGGGTPDAAPPWATLLKGCGFAETTTGVDPADGKLYSPISDAMQTLTIYVYYDGILHKMLGCMGTFSLTGEAGNIATAEFTFTGTYNTPTATAMATPTYNNTSPPIVELAGLAWNGSSTGLITGSFTFDIGNQITLRPDVNSVQGLYAVYISSRNPTGGFTPEATSSLATSMYADYEAATLRTFTCVVGGTGSPPGGSGAAVEGNTVIFSCPKAQVMNIQYGDRDGIRTYDLTIAPRRNAGNDEFTILFS